MKNPYLEAVIPGRGNPRAMIWPVYVSGGTSFSEDLSSSRMTKKMAMIRIAQVKTVPIPRRASNPIPPIAQNPMMRATATIVPRIAFRVAMSDYWKRESTG